jgi:Fe-S-cluster-containing dehydrogenase component
MRIKIDYARCTGCKLCQVACSLQHTGTVNPQRSRIRVFVGEDVCLPVIAGPYTEAACNSKENMVINGQDVDGCVVCRASCPVKVRFSKNRIRGFRSNVISAETRRIPNALNGVIRMH